MNDLLNQTVVTTYDFDRWWRETGQFIGVAAQCAGEELELLRRYVSSVYNDHSDEIEDLKKQRDEAEDDAAKAEREASEDMDAFKEKIFNIINEEGEDTEVIKRIAKEVS